MILLPSSPQRNAPTNREFGQAILARIYLEDLRLNGRIPDYPLPLMEFHDGKHPDQG